MKTRTFSILLLFLSHYFLMLNGMGQTVSEVQKFPGDPRDDGTEFTIGHRAFCGTGLKIGWSPSRDMYVYNMIKEEWGAVEPLPQGEARQYACGFASADRGFIFGGVKGNSFLNDLWIYDPGKDNWRKGSPLPDSGRSGSACFTLGDTAYIIGGKTSQNNFLKEVWAYDMEQDEWKQKDELPFPGIWRASATSNQESGYLIFGKQKDGEFAKDLYRYNSGEDSWEKITSFPGEGRTHARMTETPGRLVIIGGRDPSNTFYRDIREFELDQKKWEDPHHLPGKPIRGGMCFTHCNTLWYTTGLNEDLERSRSTYKVELSEKPDMKDRFLVFPNPGKGRVTLKFKNEEPQKKAFVKIRNPEGKLIYRAETSCTTEQLDISGSTNGVYLIIIRTAKGTATRKLVVR